MDKMILKELQNAELGILNDVTKFIEDEDIKYSLYGGTLLGAVRHNGFIPWDDDIDIVMTRSEFNKFCTKFSENPLPGYHLEYPGFDINCDITHCKVRKDNTLLLQSGEIEGSKHQGIWIDIFPLDKISDSLTGKKIKLIGFLNILLTRANAYRDDESLKTTLIKKAIRIIPKKYRMSFVKYNLDKLNKYQNEMEDEYEWTSMSTIYNINKFRLPTDLHNNYTKITFEDKYYMVFEDYLNMLFILFGNYNTLPPLEERKCKHDPRKVIFNKYKT